MIPTVKPLDVFNKFVDVDTEIIALLNRITIVENILKIVTDKMESLEKAFTDLKAIIDALPKTDPEDPEK